MKTSPPLASILVIALVVSCVTAACRTAKSMLPPRYVVNTEREARALGWPHMVAVTGTGSMQPYIPASPDPSDIVALADVETAPYDSLKRGDLVIFRMGEKSVIHQIVARQGDKWISSGLNNRHYDGPAVTRETFLSRVKKVYILATAAKRSAYFAIEAQSPALPLTGRRFVDQVRESRLASLPVKLQLKSRPGSRP